jgi:hypothetical protein
VNVVSARTVCFKSRVRGAHAQHKRLRGRAAESEPGMVLGEPSALRRPVPLTYFQASRDLWITLGASKTSGFCTFRPWAVSDRLESPIW